MHGANKLSRLHLLNLRVHGRLRLHRGANAGSAEAQVVVGNAMVHDRLSTTLLLAASTGKLCPRFGDLRMHLLQLLNSHPFRLMHRLPPDCWIDCKVISQYRKHPQNHGSRRRHRTLKLRWARYEFPKRIVQHLRLLRPSDNKKKALVLCFTTSRC